MLTQALSSYEQAAKLQGTADFKKQITTLKKQIQRQKAGKDKASPKKQADSAKPASSFAFGNSRGTDASDAGAGKQDSKILAAPTVGEIHNDDDYTQAKKSMVQHLLCHNVGLAASACSAPDGSSMHAITAVHELHMCHSTTVLQPTMRFHCATNQCLQKSKQDKPFNDLLPHRVVVSPFP